VKGSANLAEAAPRAVGEATRLGKVALFVSIFLTMCSLLFEKNLEGAGSRSDDKPNRDYKLHLEVRTCGIS
jgi:hypothetical protein